MHVYKVHSVHTVCIQCVHVYTLTHAADCLWPVAPPGLWDAPLAVGLVVVQLHDLDAPDVVAVPRHLGTSDGPPNPEMGFQKKVAETKRVQCPMEHQIKSNKKNPLV